MLNNQVILHSLFEPLAQSALLTFRRRWIRNLCSKSIGQREIGPAFGRGSCGGANLTVLDASK
jgi:hypothetical protein